MKALAAQYPRLRYQPASRPIFSSTSTTSAPRKDKRGSNAGDRQHPRLRSGRQLIMHEVHRPNLIGSQRRAAILTQLGLDPTLGRFMARLQTQLAIQAADALNVHPPTFRAQQKVNAPIAIADMARRNLRDPFTQLSLPGSTGAVVVGRSYMPLNLNFPAKVGPANREHVKVDQVGVYAFGDFSRETK